MPANNIHNYYYYYNIRRAGPDAAQLFSPVVVGGGGAHCSVVPSAAIRRLPPAADRPDGRADDVRDGNFNDPRRKWIIIVRRRSRHNYRTPTPKTLVSDAKRTYGHVSVGGDNGNSPTIPIQNPDPEHPKLDAFFFFWFVLIFPGRGRTRSPSLRAYASKIIF